MNYSPLLSSLKMDIGMTTSAYDERLKGYLKRAKQEIEREGITLDPGRHDDNELIVNLAGWYWRKRDTGEGIPRMIRWQLNNRLFGGTPNE